MATDSEYIGAFIDLVGVRSLARRDPGEYLRALDIFQSEVADQCTHLEDSDAQIRFFSDSAFIQAKDARKLLEFLMLLRYGLALQGVYFKGAVRKGDLEPKRASELPAVKDHADAATRVAILDGWYFGPNAVPTYGLQEHLKGIGVYVDTEGLDSQLCQEMLVSSCFIHSEGSGTAEAFSDLKMSKGHLSSGILERYLNKFFVAKTTSKRLGRLFVSFLVTWIKSIEFEEWKPGTFERKDLISILLDGGFVRMFGDVRGVEMIYYALLGSVWSQQEHLPPEVFSEVRGYIRSRAKLIRDIDTAPEEILPKEIQEACLLELSAELMYGPREEREALAIMKEILPNREYWRGVADELNERGLTSPSGGKWTGQRAEALARRFKLKGMLGTEVKRGSG